MKIKTFKYRLYPNKQQEEKLLWTLDQCRFTYNKLLEMLNEQEVINRGEIQASIVDLKKDHPHLKGVYSKTLQYECYRIFSNLKALGQLKKKGRRVGKLRFKGRGWFKTFYYNQSGFAFEKTDNRLDRLHLSKIGDLPIRIHRPFYGRVKQVVVKRYASGDWYAFVAVEDNYTEHSVPDREAVGIDVGINSYLADSDGRILRNPKHLQEKSEKLKREQRKLARKKKGSQNRAKQRIKVAKVYQEVQDARRDFLHKLSCFYIENYKTVIIEDLNVQGLVKIQYNARNTLDASWSTFFQFLEYKAGKAGREVVKVNPKNTTQKCSSCGQIVKKELKDRIHKCECGLVIDRDLNAARNIFFAGRGLPEEPLETEPLSIQVSSVDELGSSFLTNEVSR